MKLFRLILGLMAVQFVGGIVVFGSTPAAGQPETETLRWKRPVIRISVSSSLVQPSTNIKANSDVLGALSRSLEAWSNAAGIEFRLEVSDRQNVSPHGQKGDGVSLITIAQSPENVLFFARDPMSEAARTRVFYDKRGFITEADIVLNPFQQFSTDGTYGTFDLETTFAHEVGHLLGLKHSAVIGSLMSDKVARNAVLRDREFIAPLLSESDVAAIRALYGNGDDERCCRTISGKLVLQSGKAARQTVVWAEDSETGQIVGQTETSADGVYRIGGLINGEYSLYWQRRGVSESASGEIARANVAKNHIVLPLQKLPARRADVLLTHIGVGMQLGESAVEVRAGGRYLIVLGGKNLVVDSVSLEFSSPYLRIEDNSLRSEDFGDELDVIGFELEVDDETPAGIYSIFARDREGRRGVLIGAISVRNDGK